MTSTCKISHDWNKISFSINENMTWFFSQYCTISILLWTPTSAHDFQDYSIMTINFIAKQSHWTLTIISVIMRSWVWSKCGRPREATQFGLKAIYSKLPSFLFCTLYLYVSFLKLLKLLKSPWKEILEQNHLKTLRNFGKK